MIVVVAEYVIGEGNVEKVLELLNVWAPLARAEEGNRAFIVNQSTEDPRQLLLYEQYVDQAAFDFHSNRPEFKTIVLDQIAPLLDNRFRRMFTVAG
ncbi:MAG: putative quinol monooxygenase [Thermomicrobiales bacterium]